MLVYLLTTLSAHKDGIHQPLTRTIQKQTTLFQQCMLHMEKFFNLGMLWLDSLSDYRTLNMHIEYMSG